MPDGLQSDSQTGARDLLALLALAGLLQLLLSYRTVVGDSGAGLLDNVLWPYLVVGSVAYRSGRLDSATVKLILSASGAVLAGVTFVVDPLPEKLIVASALVVAGVFYALEVFADGDGMTYASP